MIKNSSLAPNKPHEVGNGRPIEELIVAFDLF